MAVPVTVMRLPISALVAVKIALFPLLFNWPPVADQLKVIGHVCGLAPTMVMVDGLPMARVVGLAEQRTCGASGCLILNFAMQVAEFDFFMDRSAIVELAE